MRNSFRIHRHRRRQTHCFRRESYRGRAADALLWYMNLRCSRFLPWRCASGDTCSYRIYLPAHQYLYGLLNSYLSKSKISTIFLFEENVLIYSIPPCRVIRLSCIRNSKNRSFWYSSFAYSLVSLSVESSPLIVSARRLPWPQRVLVHVTG